MASKFMKWIYTALILLAGLVFLPIALGAHLALEGARKLVAAGQQTEGTVTEVVTGKRSTAFRYGYTYTVGAANLRRTNRDIPYGEKDKLRPGMKIRVWYDAAKPERATTQAELADLESWGKGIAFPLFGVALIG